MNKVKLTCSWCEDDVLFERFCRTYVSSLNYDPNVIFTNSDDYNWLVVINYPRYAINFPKERTLGVIMEPSWTKHYELKFILEKYCKYIFSHTKENSPQYIYYPGLLPFHLDYHSGSNLDYFINTTFPKNKLCSFVVSYNQSEPHPSCLYKQRVDFAKQILQTDLNVNIYGNNWDKSGILDQRIKGPILNKKDALIDYKFSIAIENCVENGYFTEKFTDCILTNTIPLYYGCPNIQKFFKNAISFWDLTDTTEIRKKLQTLTSFEFDKKCLANKFNLYAAVTKFINHCN